MSDARQVSVIDGRIHGEGDVTVDALGGVFQFGEGLYETLPVIGGRACFLAEHWRRLTAAAGELGLKDVPEERVWHDDLMLLCEVCGGEDLAARLFLFRDGASVRRAVVGTDLPADVGMTISIGLAAPEFQGARPLAHLKTLSSLAPKLALQEGTQRGLDEVILVAGDGTILEGTHSNVFFVTSGELFTPAVELPLLPGVTRQLVIEAAPQGGISVREGAFTWADLQRAQEVFVTSSVRGIRPASSVDGRPLRDAPGPVTRVLKDAFLRRQAGD